MTGITPQEIERIARMYASGLSIESDVRSLLRHIRSEQSRIDEAVAKERERCADELLFWRDATPTFTGAWHDGRRAGLETAAAIVRAMAPDAPTPTTEEGA